jgi:hypothetical protein
MTTLKTLPYTKSRVLQSKRLLDAALRNVNRYAQALLQYQSDQQQQMQQIVLPVRAQYSQTGTSMLVPAQTGAKAIEKINKLGSKLTSLLDGVMVLLKSKNDDTIYSNLGCILYYLDFILDPFLISPGVSSLNTWSLVDVKMLTTNPIGKTVTSLVALVKVQTKKNKPHYLFKAQQVEQKQKKQEVKPITTLKGLPSLSSVLSLGMMDLSKPTKKRARTSM